MAIAKAKTIAVDNKPEYVRPQVLPAPKPISVDTAYEPRTNLLQHVSGASWTVTYYKQVKTSEEASEAFNVNRPAPYQQYLKIENFEIRVTTPLSLSPNNQNSSMEITGVGLIYPSIVPDHGDTFIADVGDGRLGLFNIAEVTQKSHLKDTVYEIEYHIVDWVNHDTIKHLDEKVVKNNYYERKYADYGRNPILNEEEHGIFDRITLWQSRIVRHYFDSFFNAEHRTFLVPVPGIVLYDPFIVEFIRNIWSTLDISDLKHLHVYNRDNDVHYFVRTIWDTILTNDLYSLNKIQHEFAAIPKQVFRTGIPSLMSLTYSRLDYIYHPVRVIDPKFGEYEVPNIGKVKFTDVYHDTPTGRKFTISITKLPGLGFVHPSLQQYAPIPEKKRYESFSTYVLSEAFYQKDKANMSKIELMLLSILENKEIDAKELLTILEGVLDWGEIERFYYIPLLYALSNAALGGLTR